MPYPTPVQIRPAAGTLNTGTPGHLLGDNEYQDLLNYYSYSGSLRRRGGSLRLNPEYYDHRITTLYPMTDSNGVWHMIVASSDAIGVMESPGYMVNTTPDPFRIPDADEPWGIVARDDLAYFFRRNHHKVRRLDVTTGAMSYAGIGTPSAPTIADGGAGVIPAATFQGVIVFYNLKTGNHSAFSPVSNTLVLGSNKAVTWTWSSPNDGFVTHVGLFRTLPDQTGAYYRVALVPADLLTYTEEVLVEGMGSAAVPGVGPPGALWFAPAVFGERLWATDGRQVFPSQFLLYETFNMSYGLSVGPDDGSRIVGLYADNDRLYVQKENGLYYITGDGPSSWRVHDLDPVRGGLNHHTIAARNGTLIWPGFDALYTSDGGPPQPVTGGINTEALFKAFDMARRREFQAVMVDRDGLYILVPRYPSSSVAAEGTWARRALVYSFITGHLSTFRVDGTKDVLGDEDRVPLEIGAIASGVGPDGKPGVWIAVERTDSDSANGDHRWNILTFLDPNWWWDDVCDGEDCLGPPESGSRHQPVKTRLTTKSFSGRSGSLVGSLRVSLTTGLNPCPGATLRITPSGPGDGKHRNIDLPGNRIEQAYTMPTHGDPDTSFSFTLETAAAKGTDIEAITVELLTIGRASRSK